jgi:methylated-DNA-[protein]-cysteine S-methyltransferase
MTSTAVREHVILPSPIGPLTLVAEAGQLIALYMDVEQRRPDESLLGVPGDPAARPFAAAGGQLADYFAGQLTEFDLPLAPAGTPFQRRVWAALQTIPYGQTWSYAQLAEKIGQATAVRAIGSDGSLTGYGGGLDRKRFLLDLEARVDLEACLGLEA